MKLTRRLAVALVCGSGLAVAPGCGNEGPSGAGGSPEVFVAQVSDFVGFCHWSSAPAAAAGDASDGIHGAGPLTVYWNKRPPPGAREFPVGTIIVKESNQANAADREAFAMVKRQARGAGYNSSGADGWEWFSLKDLGDCGFMRLWRGPNAPGGESYAGMPVGDCNGCHGLVAGNDYVWDEALQLSGP
jgi:hypothetical protein